MRVLIISDSHGKDSNIQLVLRKEGPFDHLIHLGDVEGSQGKIAEMAGCPVDIVEGNNDYFEHLPKEMDIRLGKYRVLLTHGHYYYVSLDTRMLAREAHSRGFDIAMYGHTHRPRIEYAEGVIVLNPGSISYPRQEGRDPSYIIMEIDETGEADFRIRYL